MELKRGDIVQVDVSGMGFDDPEIPYLAYVWATLDGAVELLFQDIGHSSAYRWYPVSRVRKVGEAK